MDVPPTGKLTDNEPSAVSSEPSAPAASADPVMCSSYLSSPIETLLESLDDHDLEYITSHDITEAYSTLSTRIRSQARAILRPDRTLPALVPIREHAASIARALRRDIRRALVDPIHHTRKSSSPFGSYYTEMAITDHETQYARDVTTLCHHSLRVVSLIFAFEILYSLFPVRDLQDLLSDLTKIALSATLPTPGANKTWSLVFWTIQAQNLPVIVLSTRKTEVVTALRQALNGEKGLQAKLDSLKAVHTLLKRQPELFASSLSGFVPAILAGLASEDPDSRLQAAHALSGLALAKLHLLASTEFPHEAISKSIHEFIKAQTSTAAASQGELRLPSLLSQAFASSGGKEPFWAVVILACMILLSDHFLFLRQSLKFCVNGLGPAANHKRTDIQALHTPVWRTLLWAFSRLPVDRTWLQLEDPNTPDEQIGVKGRAFRMLRQELRNGKGAALVGELLRSGTGGAEAATVGNASRAVLVVTAMIAGERRSDPRDGVLLLHRLVSAIGTPKPATGKERNEWDNAVDVPLGLFDGTLLEAGPDRTKDAVRSLAEVRIDRIRQLSEEETLQHWDGLMAAWIDAVERSCQRPAQFSSELLDIWQSLLLVRTDLTQEHGHLTASAAFASQVASIVNGFFIQSAEVDVQVRRIVTVTKLWAVMRNVYSTSWLPAESILAGALRVKFSLDEESVRGAWSQLCADLISVGIPTLLHVIFTRSERKEEREVTRALWVVLARTWQDADDRVHWDELASFLVIPFKAWVMTDGELELWESTLRTAIALARSISMGSAHVIDRIFQRMSEGELDALVLFPKGINAILAYVDLKESTALPIKLLTAVDRALTSNYPPQPEPLATCLEILRLLGQIIASASAAQLVQLLCALEKGLCCWIGDEKAAMLQEEHNRVVEELYCGTLNLLRNLPRSLETLVAISPFLTSAFGRLTPSAIGPLSFSQFWRATYHGLETYRSSYPDSLKACLQAFSDAYGGSIADGLSYETQVTGMSTVPDSQPTYRSPEYSRFAALGPDGPSLSLDGDNPLTHTPKRHTSPDPPAKRRRLDHPMGSEELPDNSRVQEHAASDSKNADIAAHERSVPPSSAPHHPVASQEQTPETPLHPSTPLSTPTAAVDQRPPPPSRKRSSPHTAVRERLKRRKTESDLDHFATSPNTPRRHSEDHMPRSSLVQPPSPLQHFSSPAPESVSQNTDTRKRKRVTDWVSMSMNIQNSVPREAESQPSRSGPSTPKRLSTRASTPSSAEYDSWEAGASMEEIMQLQRELVGTDHIVPETDVEELDDLGGTEPASEPEDDNVLLSPSLALAKGPERHPQRRSQTAPLGSPQRHIDRPTPLRRNQTTSTKLDTLQRAYTAMTNNASQIPVADLVEATSLVNRIQTALNEQLARRLAHQRSGDNA
ncbi:hypothetical protein LshimejAT787_2300260 [Lyophyllum shimeji]|uniref:Telomere-associated protein Rif1 N-terminal domain-containing protein n=1 Tax=Lyophyllum shimeji TaxID=47721 RepID=A0A9P3Q2H3_LYOSH|nr:hypothetical protein LshimejAT787_2300260 [Lyophyllum shimeji]